jgi:hypothetical protein
MIKSAFRPTIFFLACALTLYSSSSAQTVARKTNDSLGAHKIVNDRSGKILSWYKPDVPGAGYAHVSKVAAEFVKSGTPVHPGTGLPLYLVTCCFEGPHIRGESAFKAGNTGENWMHNPAMVYAGMVHSLVTGYAVFSGDSSYVGIVKNMLDYQLQHGTTPADWVWAKVPYASSNPFEKEYYGATKWEKEGMRGDGLHGIEPDKVGDLGYAYLLFYESTGDTTYLRAAINCADALAKNISPVDVSLDYFSEARTKRSPWPFRLNARNGLVIDEYCSQVVDPIRLFDELLRIKNTIGLDTAKMNAYSKARNTAWNWLYSKNGPMKTYIWNAYFEDIPNDPDRANRNQVSPLETARYVLRNPQLDSNIDINVPALIQWVESAFGTENMDAIKEQTWCYVPMGSHTARFASICAMWYERTGDTRYKEKAYRYFNNATYCTDPNGVVRVGPTWPSSWFSDGYSDYIRHFLDGIAAVPEWAPEGENHLLSSKSVVQRIKYTNASIDFQTFDPQGTVVMRVTRKPRSVNVGDKTISSGSNLQENSWTWTPLKSGGVLRARYSGGNNVSVRF